MCATIFSQITRYSRESPDKPAIVAPAREPLSYGHLFEHVASVVDTLNRFGVGRGDRVAIIAPPGPELATLTLAVMAGAAAAPLNPEYREAEFEFCLSSLKPALVIVLSGVSSSVESVASTRGIPVARLRMNPASAAGQFVLEADLQPRPGVAVGFAGPDETALLLHTSGTTAKPKLVPLTHRNLSSSVENLTMSLQLTKDDVCLHMLPMFHIGGIVDVLAAPLSTGGTVVCAPRFSAPGFFNCLEEFDPTWTQAAPAMIGEILDDRDRHPDLKGRTSLRFIRSVSAPLPAATMTQFEDIFGIPVIEIYGMTETAGVITSNPVTGGPRKPGSVGLPAGTEVRIVDASGHPQAATQTGEVAVRGANVMSGYEDPPGGNEQYFFNDWFRSGDQGYLDEDGYLFLTGRIKEIINRGGEKISPQEVDSVIRSHPAVVDAATFPIPHRVLGEDVAAAVVLRDGGSLTRAELVQFLSQRLAYFKVPRAIQFVDRIPKTPGGKLRRIDLARELGVRGSDAKEIQSSEAPRTMVAKLLADMWEHALNVRGIGIHDDFFDLGGDSMKGATFVNELQRQWNAIVYISALFDAPTIAAFEQYLLDHHPEFIARILGRRITTGESDPGRGVDDAKLAEFRSLVPRFARTHETPTEKNPAMVFILSAPRSGSTLLRAMLAGSSHLFAPPELYLLPFDDLADRRAWATRSQGFLLEGNIRAVMELKALDAEDAEKLVAELERERFPTREYYRLLQDWIGPRTLIDKTPFYAIEQETLARAESFFQDALYIHLVRHPYGMVRSFEEAHLAELWYRRLVGNDAAKKHGCSFTPREFAELTWITLNRNILSFLDNVPGIRQHFIRFEDLVTTPPAAVDALCRFLGVEFDPAILDPRSSVKARMTDGLHPESRMIGDMKFHQHEGIDPGVAGTWTRAYSMDFLSSQAWEVANALGYRESVASVAKRTEFDI